MNKIGSVERFALWLLALGVCVEVGRISSRADDAKRAAENATARAENVQKLGAALVESEAACERRLEAMEARRKTP